MTMPQWSWMIFRLAELNCHRSSVVERILGKDEVTGSSPVGGLGIGVVVDGLQQLKDIVGMIRYESSAENGNEQYGVVKTTTTGTENSRWQRTNLFETNPT